MAILLLLACAFLIPNNVAAQECYSSNISSTAFNPGMYDQSTLSDFMCRYACQKSTALYPNNSYSYSGLYQGNICLCLKSYGSAANVCNISCPSSSSSNCGAPLTTYANVYQIGCAPTINATSFNVTASAIGLIGAQFCCDRSGISGSGIGSVTYSNQFQMDSSPVSTNFSCALQRLNYAFRNPGYSVTTWSITNSDNITTYASALGYVSQKIGIISPITISTILVQNSYTFQVSLASFPYGTITLSLGNGVQLNSTILSSRYSTLGSTFGSPIGSVSSTNVWLLPSPPILQNVTLMDIRLVMSNSGNTNPSLVFIQIWRPYCSAANTIYCYLSKSCIVANSSSCSPPSGSNLLQTCAGSGVDKVSAAFRSCLNATTKLPLPTSSSNTLGFTSYWLQSEIGVNLTNLRQLNLNTGEYFASLVSTPITLQPGDVPAIYQQAGAGLSIATGAGSSLTLDSSSITGFNSRTNSPAVSTYPNPTVTFIASTAVAATSIPLVSFTMARANNLSFTFQYVNHTCYAAPFGCINPDLYTMRVSAVNDKGNQSVNNSIRVFMPISNVTIITNGMCLTFTKCNVTIPNHIGSLPQYIVNFNDSQGSVAYNLTGSNTALGQINHFYTWSKNYTINVTAYNSLSSESIYSEVQIIDAVQGLQIVSGTFPGGLVNQTLNFTITLSQGTNTVIQLDFGDGSPIVSIPASTSLAPVQLPYISFFTPVMLADLTSTPVATPSVGAALKNGSLYCAKLCMTNTTFSCQFFTYINSTGICALYTGPVNMNPTFSVKWNQAGKALYVLQNQTCAGDLSQIMTVAMNASSGSITSKIWTANSAGAQAIMFSFSSFVQINFLNVYSTPSGYITFGNMQISNDTFTWTTYANQSGTVNFTILSSGATSYGIVFDPPIITRFFQFNALGYSGSYASGRFAFSGCQMQGFTYPLTHTFLYNQTSLNNIVVNATNPVSSASVVLPYFLDVFINNLQMTCLQANPFAYTGGVLSFNVSGTWSSFVRISIVRHDLRVIANATYTTYSPWYVFDITFNNPGLWVLTVTAENYAGLWSFTLNTPITVILLVSTGCSYPYNDLIIPNGCSPASGNCESNYVTTPGIETLARKWTRSSYIKILSNTTSACSRPPIYTWNVSKFDTVNMVFNDYYPSIQYIYATRYNNSTPAFNGTQLYSLYFKPRTFDFGLYRIVLTVSIIPDTVTVPDGDSAYVEYQNLATTSTTFISVTSSPLLACANDGIMSVGSYWDPTVNVTLDASCSSDPDKWPEEPQNIYAQWDCFRACESAPKYDTFGNFISWNATSNPYSTTCTQPANSTAPASTMGCFMPLGLHVSGPITPLTMDIWNSTRNPMLAYPVENKDYVDNWVYAMQNGTLGNQTVLLLNSLPMFFQVQHYFILRIRSIDGRYGQNLAIVNMAARLPPIISVSCVANCAVNDAASPLTPQYIIGPTSMFKLALNLRNRIPWETYTYKWTMSRTSATTDSGISYAALTEFLVENPANQTTDYDWSHTSTSTNCSGISFDTNYPLFPTTYYNRAFILVIRTSIDFSNPLLVSYAYVIFYIMKPPSLAGLNVMSSPSYCLSLNTNVTIMCSGGTTDAQPLLYSIGYTSTIPTADTNQSDSANAAAFANTYCSWIAIGQRSCIPPGGAVILPTGNPYANYTLYVCISLKDAYGSRVYGFYPALQVVPGPAAAAFGVASNTEYVSTIAANNPNRFTSFAFALAQTINPSPTGYTAATSINSTESPDTSTTTVTTTTASPTTTLTPEEQKQAAHVVGSLINAFQSMAEPSSLSELTQTGNLLQTLTLTGDYLSPTATNSSFALVNTMGSTFASTSSGANPNELETAGDTIVSTLTNLLTASVASQSVNVSAASEWSVMAPSDSTTLTYQSNLMTSAMQSISETVLKTKVPGEKMTVLGGSFGSQSMTPENMLSQSFTPNPGSCTKFMFGSIDYVFGNYTPSSVGLSNMVTNATQFLFVTNSTEMKSSNSISLKDLNGVEYNITGATGDKMIQIWVDTTLDPTTVPELNVNLTPYTLPLGKNMLTHKIWVKANSSLFINVQHYLNWTLVPVTVMINGTSTIQYMSVLQNNASYNGSNIEFLVYVQKGKLPTDNNYVANCTLPNLDPASLQCTNSQTNITDSNAEEMYGNMANLTNLNFYQTLSQVPDRCTRFSQTMQNPWTCMIPTSFLNNTVDEFYYVGVRSIIWNWTLPFVNGTYNPNMTIASAPTSIDNNPEPEAEPIPWQYVSLNYTFFAYYSSCFFFDTASQGFSQDGCTVGKCSSPYATQCFCTHLTSFSNAFKLPTISFDVSAVNINALNNSPGVMLFLISLICAYCIVWIWARYADLQAEERLGVTYLPSNSLQDAYGYEITIWTSHLPGSGTSANVSMILAGDNLETTSRWLCAADDNKKPFQSGSIDMFLLTSPEWLGSLSHIRIWHDNTGRNPSWYLLRILVRDLYTNTKYYFISNTWLSAVKGNGMLDRLVPVAGKEELRSFQNVMWTNASSRLLDGHLWISVGTRPSRSRFTRVQRLTCCLVICLTSILFNLLGYIIQNSAKTELLTAETNPDPPVITLGPISITSFTLTISLISAGCTIPVNMIIALLFQQRRIRQLSRSPDDPYDRYSKASSDELRRQKEEEEELEQQEEQEKGACRKCLDTFSRCISSCMDKIFPLPWWSHYVAYVIAFITTFVCFFCSAVLAYSNIPQEWQQNAWLSSIILSLVQSILIVQPLQIFIMILIFTFILRLPQEDENEMSKEIAVRRPLVEIPSTNETDLSLVKADKPPPLASITKTINEQKKRTEKIESQLTGALLYFLFLILVFLTCQTFASSLRYEQTSVISNQMTLQFPFENQHYLSTVDDVWDYLMTKVVPSLYSANLSAYNTANASSPLPGNAYTLNTLGLTSDGFSYLLGARLRQVRVAPGGCTVPNLFSSIIPVCYGEYSIYQTDTASYVAGWTGLQLVPTNTTTPFMYTGVSSTFGSVAQSAAGSFSGAGYIANLTGSLDTSLELLANLSATNWIDAKTRKIYVEFLAYNPSTDMYTVGNSELDLAPTGIVYKPDYYVLTLNRYLGAKSGLNLIFHGITALILIIFTIMTLVDLCSSKVKLENDPELLLDVLISVTFVILLACYGVQVVSSLYFQGVIMQAPTEFTNLRLVCELDLVASFFLGLLAFLLYIRILKWLRLFKRVRFVVEVVVKASSKSFALAFQVFLGFLAYLLAFYLLYFSQSRSYSTFPSALVNLVASLSWAFKFPILEMVQCEIGAVLFSLYAITLLFTSMDMFVPILVASLRAVRLEHLEEGIDPNNPIAYASWKVKMFCGCESQHDDEVFEYLTGAADVDEVCKNMVHRVDDLANQVKSVELYDDYREERDSYSEYQAIIES